MNNRRIVGKLFRVKSEGIGLHNLFKPRRFDAELVGLAQKLALDKELPNTVAGFAHIVSALVPVVKAADHRNALRVGRPNPENNAVFAVAVLSMRSEIFISRSRVAVKEACGQAAFIIEAVIHKSNSYSKN